MNDSQRIAIGDPSAILAALLPPVTLACPKCSRTMQSRLTKLDPVDAARVEMPCPDCTNRERKEILAKARAAIAKAGGKP